MTRSVTIALAAFTVALTSAGALAARGDAALSAEATAIAPGGVPASAPSVTAAAKTVIQVYKSPTCGCCKNWVDHVREAGFVAEVHDLPEEELQARKRKLGVGPRLASCHTAIVNGYVVEGHVPAADIQRLLRERPAVAGIAAPGMPVGSPGMEVPGGRKDKYDVVAFTKSGTTKVFASH
jgi:hypothetical protein